MIKVGIFWKEVSLKECEIVTDNGDYRVIRVNGSRPRIFRQSRSGNWYWINNKKLDSHGNKEGIIIK